MKTTFIKHFSVTVYDNITVFGRVNYEKSNITDYDIAIQKNMTNRI